MTDKLELEEQIMNCWGIIEDLKAVIDYMDDKDDFPFPHPRDYNLIKSINVLYSLKFEKLFTVFENCVDEGKI